MKKKSKIKGKSTRIPSPFDTTTHRTEWTCASKISEWINNIVKDKNIPLGRAEVETKTRADPERSDIVIFEAPDSDKVLCVIEMKQPYFNAFDEKELKEPARIKAVKRKAKYFATSNFKEFIWWCTERVNANVSIEEQICDKYALSEIENLDLIDEPRYKNRILSELKHFLTDLYEVHTGKKSEPKHPIDEILIYLIHLSIKRLSSYYRQIIEDLCHKDMQFRNKLEKWFAEQQWNFFHQPADYEKAARQAAYLLVNKILFYDLLQAKRPEKLNPLSIPEDLTKGGLLQGQLQVYFNYVLKEINYETIYDADFIDQTAFPDRKEVVDEIKSLIRTLSLYDFSKIGYDIIGRIFERLIPAEERHNLGQYFTNADVVDIILKFCLQHEKDKILDPACGAGTFLVRAYKHKQIMNQMLKHEDILRTLWGIDIAKFPAHLATINLAINDLSVDENYPYIIKEDFFNLHYGGKEEFKEHKKKELVGLGEKKIKIPYPKIVDCIIGNPPYTRQEEIPEIAGEDYKKRLIQSALYEGKIKLANISKRAGIHAYFFIHGTKFLKDKGYFGFIVSNSWLDVDYGKALQEFFLENYKIIGIIESKVERWFEEADINTSIIILQKCKDKKERDENLVRFVYLKKRLRDFIPAAQDMWEKQVERLNAIENLQKTIMAHNEFYENEDLRIYPKSQKELWDEAYDTEEKKYVGSKWGKYLRAPAIFYKILKKGSNKWVHLGRIADVRAGCYTGVNEFFYFEKCNDFKLKVEDIFLVPILRNTKQVTSLKLDVKSLSSHVFVCNKSKKELKKSEKKGALKYINWGEHQTTRERQKRAAGVLYSQVETVKSHKPDWYSLPDKNVTPTNLFMIYVINKRFIAPYSTEPICSDRCFHRLFLSSAKNDIKLLTALLNSTWTILNIELLGRLNLGLGALKFERLDAKKIFIIDPQKINSTQKNNIIRAFDKISQRPIEDIFDEIGALSPGEVVLEKVMPDRRKLDKIIMGEILGLTNDEQLEVYKAVVDLVKSRIEKAKSFGKRRKIKEGVDIDLFMKTIKDKIGDDTLWKFYREKVKKSKIPLRTIHLPAKTDKIRIDSEIFGFRLISGRKHVDCKTEDKAKYLKIFLEAGMEKIKIPKQESDLKQILPELQKIKQKIDKTIESDISTIINVKLRKKLEHLIWQEMMK